MITVNGIASDLTPLGVSQLGQVIFDNVYFPLGSYVDDDGIEQPYEAVRLDTATVSVAQRKEIVSSRVSGRNGSIKEYISAEDYVITIKGRIPPKTLTAAEIAAAGVGAATLGFSGLVGFEANREDTETLRALNDLLKVPERVAIRSKILQDVFDINFVIIEDFTLNKQSGDTYDFTLSCLSDFDTDLKDFG